MKIHRKKSEGKLSTTNGCRCLAAAAVCNNSNSRPCTRRDEAWHKGGGKDIVAAFDFRMSWAKAERKKRIPKFYCYTRKITTARERVRGEGQEGSARETETSSTAAGRRILATFPFPSMWKPSPSRGISKAITRQSQRRK